MTDRCEVYLSKPAKKELDKLRGKDPKRVVRIGDVISNVEKNGWAWSTKAERIKLLADHVGEIRDMGKGGTRLFFFWVDTPDARKLWVTAIVRKSVLSNAIGYRRYITATAKRRSEYLKSGDC